ncbi:MAG: LysR family transcriptional regulator [Oscillospiraceae bacterium]
MKVKLELYRIFKEVALCKNISTASKQLYISQSAVSQAIKQLEMQLGVHLFLRRHKGVELTYEGEMLYEYVKSAIELISCAEKKIDSIKTLTMGSLKIGASDTTTKYIILKKLEKFNKLFPHVKLQVVNRTSLEAVELLKSGQIDIACVNMPIDDAKIQVNSSFEVHDIFIGTKKYANKVYTLEEISKLPLILLEIKSNSRKYVQNYFATNGYTISPEIELGSHDLLIEFAKINLGVSCVIKEFCEDELNSGGIIKLELAQEIPKRMVAITSLKGVTLSNAAQEFIRLADESST